MLHIHWNFLNYMHLDCLLHFSTKENFSRVPYMDSSAVVFYFLLVTVRYTYTVGQKIWKSPGQKNSWNQVNQFHELFFFWPNSIFCNFKSGQKSIFELGKCFKTAKNAISRNFFCNIWFHGFFLPRLFQIFWPTVY